MSEKRDEEYFVLKLTALIKANLNTKIAGINARKSDGIELDLVDSGAYYYMSFGQSVPAFDPVVIFLVDSDQGEQAAGTSSEVVTVGVQMVISDKMEPNTENLYRRTVRYRRALKEVVRDGYAPFQGFQLVSLPDVPFIVGRQSYMALGIGVQFSFAN